MTLRAATRADLDRVREVLVDWWGGRDLTALLTEGAGSPHETRLAP